MKKQDVIDLTAEQVLSPDRRDVLQRLNEHTQFADRVAGPPMSDEERHYRARAEERARRKREEQQNAPPVTEQITAQIEDKRRLAALYRRDASGNAEQYETLRGQFPAPAEVPAWSAECARLESLVKDYRVLIQSIDADVARLTERLRDANKGAIADRINALLSENAAMREAAHNGGFTDVNKIWQNDREIAELRMNLGIVKGERVE